MPASYNLFCNTNSSLNQTLRDATISGGCCQIISTGADFSAVVGGCKNTVSAIYSSILGGKNNTVTHNYAAVFGNGLVSCSNDTFHISCINAKNTPNITAGGPFPAGTIVWKAPPLLPTDKVLVLI